MATALRKPTSELFFGHGFLCQGQGDGRRVGFECIQFVTVSGEKDVSGLPDLGRNRVNYGYARTALTTLPAMSVRR